MLEDKYASTLGFVGLLAGSLIVSFDAVALSPSLRAIENALHASTIEIYWASVAYTLGSATFLPLFPAVSNAVGRRPASIATLVLFLIGTLVCATARHAAGLLAGRVLQGIGGGGTMAMLYVVMADLYDLRQRAKALAINGMVWLIGLSVGPVMGGGFSTYVTWRWIFWIAAPINGTALILVAFFLRVLIRLPPRVDYLGAALLVASLSSFLIPLTWAGTMYAWSSFKTLVPLIIGVFGLAAFAFYELLIPKNPVLPVSILNDRTVVVSYIHIFVIGVIQFGTIFYLPLYYQVVQEYSPLISGVALLPDTLLAGLTTMVTGIVVSKVGKYKMAIFVGWAITALGCGVLTLLSRNFSIPQWMFLNFPIGVGIGVLFPATTIAAQATVKEAHMATASGLVVFVRSIGQSIGVAACNAIVSNVLRRSLEQATVASLRHNAASIAKNFASPGSILLLVQHEQDLVELKSAYVRGLYGVWWLMLALSACSLY